MRGRARNALLILPLIAWFGGLVAGPIAVLARTSFADRLPLGEVGDAWTLDAYRTILDPLYLGILWRTLLFALANAVACVLVAYPCAYLVSRQSPRRQILLLAIFLVPFWTNFLFRVLALSDVYRLHPLGLDLLYTPAGTLAAYVYNFLPGAFLPLYSVFARFDRSLLDAASDCGASASDTFRRVIWPLTRRGTVTAFLLVFIPSLGEFLIPDLVGGGRLFVLGNFLQNQFLTARNWPLGSAAILLLVAMSLIAFLGRSSEDQEGTLR